MKRNETPVNAGKAWSRADEKLVCSDYESGMSIDNLAVKYGRTQGAITFQLVKFGKIKAPSQVKTPRAIPSPQKCIDCRKQIRSDQGKSLPNVVRCPICKRRHDAQCSIANSFRELSSESSDRKCIDCGNMFSPNPNKVTLFSNLCEGCYKRRIAEKKNARVKQKVVHRRIDEGIAGTREDHKRMRTWRLS